MHLYIANPGLPWNGQFQLLADSFTATVAGDHFNIPAAYGKGQITHKTIHKDLCLQKHTYMLAANSFQGIRQSDKELYYLTFSENQLPDTGAYQLQMGNGVLSVQLREWKQALLASSTLDHMAIYPPGFSTSAIQLAFTPQWLERYAQPGARALFKDYHTLLEEKRYAVLDINDKTAHLSTVLKDSVDKHAPAVLLSRQCIELVKAYYNHLADLIAALNAGTYNEQDTLRLISYVHSKGVPFYLKPLSRAKLSAALGMSTAKFTNLFREVFQMSYSAYLQTQRMEWAATRLATGAVKVSEVANELGYENYSHFSAAFRKHTGMLPSVYVQSFKG